MKKSLTKLIVSCAAVTAVAAAMAVSASAANVTVDEAKTTITNNLEYVKGSEPSGQATILVQKNTGTAFTEGDIVYIDQQASDGTVPTDWKSIKVAALADGTYVLKMGGTGVTTLASEEFTVGEVTPPAGNVMVGDVNGDKKILVNDAVAIVDYILEKTDLTDEQFVAADTNTDNKVLINDAVAIVDYVMEKVDSLPITK